MTLERRMVFYKNRISLGVVGPAGGIHYWVELPMKADGRVYGGVEQHSRTQYRYSTTEPNHNCWLIGGTCYNDGSSLYADEVYTPLFHRCNEAADFEPMWRKLESEYRERFEKEGEE